MEENPVLEQIRKRNYAAASAKQAVYDNRSLKNKRSKP